MRSGRRRSCGRARASSRPITTVSGSIGDSVDAISSVAAATSDMPGAITRNVPSRVASARESNDEIAGKPDAELQRSCATRSCSTRRVDGTVGANVIGHQPGERPLEPLWGDVLGDVGDSLDAVAEQARRRGERARRACRRSRPAGSGRAGRPRRSR